MLLQPQNAQMYDTLVNTMLRWARADAIQCSWSLYSHMISNALIPARPLEDARKHRLRTTSFQDHSRQEVILKCKPLSLNYINNASHSPAEHGMQGAPCSLSMEELIHLTIWTLRKIRGPNINWILNPSALNDGYTLHLLPWSSFCPQSCLPGTKMYIYISFLTLLVLL